MRPEHPKESPLFAQGPSSTARLIMLSLASVLLMTADHRGNYLDRMRSALSVGVYPLQVAASLPARTGAWLSREITGRHELLSKNRQLERDLLLARGRLQRLAAMRAENARLRALLDTASDLPEQVQVARIERVDLDPTNHRVLIGQGSGDDVYTGQPVVDENGVMGQIVQVGPLSAYAMLISDASHALPVEVNRTGLRTIALGTGGTDRLSIADMPLSADIRRGDLLVTSGLGGRFPAGIPVARISEIRRDPGQPFATVSARPLAALDRSRLVLLIWPGAGLLETLPGAPPGDAEQDEAADSADSPAEDGA